MTDAWKTIATDLIGALNAIADPAERYQATSEADTFMDNGLRGVRKRIALQLKREHGKTWREIGEVMGGVTPQRAEQVSKGE